MNLYLGALRDHLLHVIASEPTTSAPVLSRSITALQNSVEGTNIPDVRAILTRFDELVSREDVADEIKELKDQLYIEHAEDLSDVKMGIEREAENEDDISGFVLRGIRACVTKLQNIGWKVAYIQPGSRMLGTCVNIRNTVQLLCMLIVTSKYFV